MFQLKGFTLGFAVGTVTGAVMRDLLANSRGVVKPAVKSLIKNTLTAMDRARESLAHVGETFEDLVSEAKSELAEAPAAKEAPAKTRKEPAAKKSNA